jgi:hypothetical protein
MRACAILVAVVVGGCSSVRVVQRDGCWVRRTSNLGQVREEIGPCARPAPLWAQDRVTRLVQECVVRADYQWQTRALAAWNQGAPLPAHEPEEKVLRSCMSESAQVMAEENATLKTRLAEAAGERDALRASAEQERMQLRASADQERTHLRTSLDKIAEHLGEAAKKPTPPAVATATATSEGRTSSEGRTESSSPGVAPAGPVTVVAPPAATPVTVVTPPAVASSTAAQPASARPAASPAKACTPDGNATRQARSAKKAAARPPSNCPTPAIDVTPATTVEVKPATTGDVKPATTDAPRPPENGAPETR